MPTLFRTSSRAVNASPAGAVHIGYVAEFKGTKYNLYARSKDEAHQLACSHFKARKTQHRQVKVTLADQNWTPLST